MVVRGIAASDGIGIGKAVCIREETYTFSDAQFAGKEKEKERLEEGIASFTEETKKLAEKIRKSSGEKEADILSGHITMLHDPFMLSQMQENIETGRCAENAVDAVCTMYADMFAAVEDELMRQRAADVRDIKARLLAILSGKAPIDLSRLPKDSVLVAKELTPSMTVELQTENVSAILTEQGGKTSHSAILARGLELPAVLGVAGITETVKEGEGLIVDGTEGMAILSPDTKTTAQYRKKQEKAREEKKQLSVYRDRPTKDADGQRYEVFANIGSPKEAEQAVQNGAEGIGLFRTEFLFMDRSSLPSEEEQYDAYAEVARYMKGKKVVIRTLDVGGDKEIPYLSMGKEENPFLGYRAIRYCLSHKEQFRVQLRAILRAGAIHGNLCIMLPFITSVEEIREAKALLEVCKKELRNEGKAFDEKISVGIMTETPASVLLAELLAKEADFFSIFTNDLTQYILAADRGNPKVEYLYDECHPAVLRGIQKVIEAAKKAGIPVAMCGAAAAEAKLIPLFLAWGLEEFSVTPSDILPTRKRISSWRKSDAKAAEKEAMGLSTGAGIAGYLTGVLKNRE